MQVRSLGVRIVVALMVMVLGLVSLGASPATAHHDPNPGSPGRILAFVSMWNQERGYSGWFTAPGHVEFVATDSTETYDYVSVRFLGVAVKRTYVTQMARNGGCTVNGEEAGYLADVVGNAHFWRVKLPNDVTGADYDPETGTWNIGGVYDVVCKQVHKMITQDQWIGFIPEDPEVETWMDEDEWSFHFDGTPPSVDAAPRIAPRVDPNGVNWHKQATYLDVTGADPMSGIDECGVITGSAEIGGTTINEDKTIEYGCTNNAGLLTKGTYTYRFDELAPDASPTVPPARNGWHAGGTAVTWNWADETSGIDDSCPTSTPAPEGVDVEVTSTCSDWAGNTAAARQTLSVDATAPTIELLHRPEPGEALWYNRDVRLRWACSDELSGPEADTIELTLTDEGADQSATGTCVDQAGNTTSDTQTDIHIDKTRPTSSPEISAPVGEDGWYLGPVDIDWNWSDSLSGVDTSRCNPSSSTDTEGPGQRLASTCFDNAANGSIATALVHVDLHDPTITAALDHQPGVGGWHTAPVTVSFTCTDPGDGSGLGDDACPAPVVVDDEGITDITRTVTDRAGRSATTTATVKVDLHDPTISSSADRDPDVDRWYTAPVTVTYTCDDPPPGSGVASCPEPVTVDTEGDHTFTGVAIDNAGRSAWALLTVLVDLAAPETTIDRTGGRPNLHRGKLTGTAVDAVSGIDVVEVRWTHPSKGAELVVADISCTDATRRSCTWSAQIPPSRAFDIHVVAIDRTGRHDPTPDRL